MTIKHISVLRPCGTQTGFNLILLPERSHHLQQSQAVCKIYVEQNTHFSVYVDYTFVIMDCYYTMNSVWNRINFPMNLLKLDTIRHSGAGSVSGVWVWGDGSGTAKPEPVFVCLAPHHVVT